MSPASVKAACGLVDGQNRSQQAHVLMVVAEHRKRKQQARRGQPARMVAQVTFVNVKRRLAIKLKQHVIYAARHLARRTKRLPAAK